MIDEIYSFERLIAPISRSEFLSSYWEKEPLVLHRESPPFYGALLRFSDIDYFLHVARESLSGLLNIVPAAGSQREHRIFKGKEISLEVAYRAFSDGDTLQLSAVHMFWPPVATLRASICEALDSDAWVNAYATPTGAQGLSVHIDTHDTLILQVDGSKDWYVYDRYIDAPVDTEARLSYMQSSLREELADRESELHLLRRVRLEKGDALYLPRGFPHKAVATEEASLHLTVGILPMYWVDLLKAAMETVCLEQADLRRALPPGFISDPEARSMVAERFREVLGMAAREAQLDKVLAEWGRRRIRTQVFPPDGHFLQIISLAGLSLDSIVRRRRGLDCCLFKQDGAWCITFARNTMRGPLQTGPALEHICNNREFRVSDLPGPLDDQSRIKLVRRLIRDGLLQLVESQRNSLVSSR